MHPLCTAQHQHPSSSVPSEPAPSLSRRPRSRWSRGRARLAALPRRRFGGVLAAISRGSREPQEGAERSGRARAKGAALRGGGALARRGRRKFRDTWGGVEQWRGELALQTAREHRRAHLCRPAARPPALRPSPWRPPRSSAARLSLGT